MPLLREHLFDDTTFYLLCYADEKILNCAKAKAKRNDFISFFVVVRDEIRITDFLVYWLQYAGRVDTAMSFHEIKVHHRRSEMR